MTQGGIYVGLDVAVVENVSQTLGLAIFSAVGSVMRHFEADETVSPPTLVAAGVKAHLMAAAGILYGAKPQVDGLLLVTWLLEAIQEAMVETAEPGDDNDWPIQ